LKTWVRQVFKSGWVLLHGLYVESRMADQSEVCVKSQRNFKIENWAS
jgi:hypothetical protein